MYTPKVVFLSILFVFAFANSWSQEKIDTTIFFSKIFEKKYGWNGLDLTILENHKKYIIIKTSNDSILQCYVFNQDNYYLQSYGFLKMDNFQILEYVRQMPSYPFTKESHFIKLYNYSPIGLWFNF